MSRNRDIKQDIENTKRKLKNLPVENEGKKNWLGHGLGGAIIDEMLIEGATKKDLDDKRIRESGSSSHISHLRNHHGLLITYPNNGGICQFDYPFQKEDIDEILKTKDNIQNTYIEKLENINETERETFVSQRVGQDILRKSILKLYSNKCAMCDVDATEVLTASHIVPWSEDQSIRLDPSNTILLCGLHDLAFDKGLITVNDDFLITFPNKPEGLLSVLKKITYKKLNLPMQVEFYPKKEFLKRHRITNSK